MDLEEWAQTALQARSATTVETVATLWSGYGRILRLRLEGADQRSAIVKSVEPPSERSHPRGWSSDAGHARKLRSYEVETHWYQHQAQRCSDVCRVPRLYAARVTEAGWTLALEDLDAAGFHERRQQLDRRGLDVCLRWLAHFHATFLGEAPEGLWPVGTYWHLDTRREELAATEDPRLIEAAEPLDAALRSARFQTLVHGDAKVANFCFHPRDQGVAAVDFQYVGGGCGIKDVAYFLSSCLSSRACERNEDALLSQYFEHLRDALSDRDVDLDALEGEWRRLYPVAWADFQRFLAGWSPGHWKRHGYGMRMVERALTQL